jgi:hypothetical protein
MNFNSVYTEGYKAYSAHCLLRSNPYPVGTWQFKKWSDGYTDAARAKYR